MIFCFPSGYLQVKIYCACSRALSVFFFLLVTQLAFAQGNGGGGDPDVPIDGGLGILLAAGVTYGVKRVMKTQNETSSGEKK